MKPPKPVKLTFNAAKHHYRKMVGNKQFSLGTDQYKATRLAMDIQQLWKQNLARGIDRWTAGDLARIDCMYAVIYEIDSPIRALNAVYRYLSSDNVDPAPPEYDKTTGRLTYKPLPLTGKTQEGPTTVAKTLHSAIEAYEQTVIASKGRSAEWIKVHGIQLNRIKADIEDLPLDQFGYDAIRQLVDIWIGLAKAGEIKGRTVKNWLAALAALCSWLGNTAHVTWTAPKGLAKLLKLPSTLRQAPAPQAFAIEDLTKLWQACQDDIERFILLAGLNFGATAIDLATLTPDMIIDGVLVRNRHKTGQSIRIPLWAETLKAGIPAVTVRSCRRAWERLRRRAGVTGGHKLLRSTASQLVRNSSGRELAERFLAHAELGAGRNYHAFQDWDALADAVTRLRADLEAVFGRPADGFMGH